ncbi:MAG: DUF3152 domain-containing protein [Beutenbergiaceae bacterium]
MVKLGGHWSYSLALIVGGSVAALVLALAPIPTPAQAATAHPYIRFSAGTPIGHGWSPYEIVTPGDWDRNGFEDLMAIDSAGALWFYPGRAANKFGARRQIGHRWDGVESVRGGVDWDRDGNLDLIARLPDGTLRLYPGNGRGGFSPSRQIGHGWQIFRTWTVLDRSIGEHPAIVATDFSGRMHIYPTINGRFLQSVQLGGGWSTARVISGPADWDKDGYSDLLVVNGEGRLLLYTAARAGRSFRSWQIGGRGWRSFPQIHPVASQARSVQLWAVNSSGELINYRATYSGSNSAWVPPLDSVLGTIPIQASGSLSRVSQSLAGTGNGGRLTYSVQVESGLPILASAFAGQIHTTLNDGRGWRRDFVQVSSGGSIRIILASPRLVDRLCAPLPTNGYTSCRNGNSVIINAARWAGNATAFANAGGSLTVYRQYLINHEVGHALGNRHQTCGGRGRLAPIMQQQTLQVSPCRVNAWPYPRG